MLLSQCPMRAASCRPGNPCNLCSNGKRKLLQQQNGKRKRTKTEQAVRLNALDREILRWNPLQLEFVDPGPLKALPLTMDSWEEYRASVMPLIREECRAQIWQDLSLYLKSQLQLRPDGNISEPSEGCCHFVDKFMAISNGNFGLVTELHLISDPGQKVIPLSKIYQDHDLLVIFTNDIQGCSIFTLLQQQNVCFGTVGAVQSYANKNQLRAKMRSMSGPVYVVKICSLTSIVREWEGVEALKSSYFRKFILRPTMNPEPDRRVVRQIHDELPTFPRKNLNPSQRYAVSMSLASTGFTLIQGPPGCGKTRTIEELLCAILAGFAKNGTSETSPKILCCAPSNAAIDEVAVRVMARMQSNHGLLRIGSYNYAEKSDSQAKDIHIDTLIPNYYEKKKYKQGQNLAKRSDIIFTTLSSAGLQVLNGIDFDFIVVDESTQSVEPSTLIPLRFKAKAYVLVGDPQQLPATVISNVDNYKCSLFERFMKNGVKPCLLDVQYRMHAEIRRFPSATFYEDKLQDGPNIAERAQLPVYFTKDTRLGPYLVFDCIHGKEQKSYRYSSSVENPEEAFIVARIVHFLTDYFTKADPDFKPSSKIAIVTPYRGQIGCIRQQLKRLQIPGCWDMYINTVDGFQGQEREIIIFSAVRTNMMGFLEDIRRLNVAITRARNALFIVGNSKRLKTNVTWAKLFEDARKRGLVRDVRNRGDVHQFFSTPAKYVSPEEIEKIHAAKEADFFKEWWFCDEDRNRRQKVFALREERHRQKRSEQAKRRLETEQRQYFDLSRGYRLQGPSVQQYGYPRFG